MAQLQCLRSQSYDLYSKSLVAQTHQHPFKYLSCYSCGNLLYSEGVKNLMAHDWTNLKKLYLSYCHIGDEGALEISKQDFPHLEDFYLSSNSVTSEGIIWLAKKDWKKIKTIHLHDNKIDDDGGIQLVGG